MSPAAARSASACSARMLSSTQAIAPAPSPPGAPSSPVATRARAPAHASKARRVTSVLGIAGDAEAWVRPAAEARRERFGQRAGDSPGSAGSSSSYSPGRSGR